MSQDQSLQHIIEQIKGANSPLVIQGQGSKQFYGNPVEGKSLETASLSGIIEYDPSELVLTAKAGTSLSELEEVLAENGQMMAFEPHLFNGKGTVGGMIATGLAGARRPWSGGARDYVLGLHLVNGRGEYCRFGGQVMKNVAGYDVSRLMVGALGCLGLITQVSLKVLPKPQIVQSATLSISAQEFLDRVRPWMDKMTPVSGVAHDGKQGYLRLEGFSDTVTVFAKEKGLSLSDDMSFWDDLRNQTHAVLKQSETGQQENVWRISLPKWTVIPELSSPYLMDWAGAQYWIRGGDKNSVQTLAKKYGGYLCSYNCSEVDAPVFEALSAGEMALHRNLKKAYDPEGIFNPGRLYPGI